MTDKITIGGERICSDPAGEEFVYIDRVVSIYKENGNVYAREECDQYYTMQLSKNDLIDMSAILNKLAEDVE